MVGWKKEIFVKGLGKVKILEDLIYLLISKMLKYDVKLCFLILL